MLFSCIQEVGINRAIQSLTGFSDSEGSIAHCGHDATEQSSRHIYCSIFGAS